LDEPTEKLKGGEKIMRKTTIERTLVVIGAILICLAFYAMANISEVNWQTRETVRWLLIVGFIAFLGPWVYKDTAILVAVALIGIVIITGGMLVERIDVLVGEMMVAGGIGILAAAFFSCLRMIGKRKKRGSTNLNFPGKVSRKTIGIFTILMISLASFVPVIRASTSQSLKVKIDIVETNEVISREEFNNFTFVEQNRSLAQTEINDFTTLSSEVEENAAQPHQRQLELEIYEQNRTKIYCLTIIDYNETRTYYIIVEDNLVFVSDESTSELFELPENVTFNEKAFVESSGGFTTLSTKYLWDNVWFVEGGSIKYPHCDRSTYGISIWAAWAHPGNKLWHYQFDKDTSTAIANGGPTLIGGAIGTAIALIGGGEIGALIGAVIAIILSWASNKLWLDEEGCLWFWVSKSWVKWLGDNAWWLAILYLTSATLAISLVLKEFCTSGYLRVGTVTYADFIGAGNPSPPPPPPPPPPPLPIPKPHGGGGGAGKYGPFLL
jgi:hypothetical protein